MSIIRVTRVGAAILLIASLAACSRVEYSGYESGLDGTLWRQLAAYQDPLSQELFAWDPVADYPGVPGARARPLTVAEYMSNVTAVRWDRVSEVDPAWVEQGGVVIYDIAEESLSVSFSVFISSGPRRDGPTDQGTPYFGPSAVFTCHGVLTGFEEEGYAWTTWSTYELDDCPPELVAAVQSDAAFAPIDVFSG